MEPSFSNLLAVVAIAFAAPLLLGFVPRLVLPAVVLEIVAGIIVGPDVLGLVEVDAAVEVLRVLGLAMLLFLAGLELDLRGLRGSQLRIALVGFAASFALAVGAGVALEAAGVVRSPLFVAIVLSSTGAQAALLGGLLVLAGVVVLALRSGGARCASATRSSGWPRPRRRSGCAARSSSSSRSPLSPREAGLEVILGAFVAGILLGVLDADGTTRHPEFRVKLDAVGFGVLIPAFFVASGLTFDLDALTSSTAALVLVPVGFAALAGALQAVSLPFIVASTAIGRELQLLTPGAAAGLIAGGLLSVLVLPPLALTLLRRVGSAP